MATKLTDEQRKAVEACAGQPVLVADKATNKVYYLLNEEAFAHRELIAEGIRSPEIAARDVLAELRALGSTIVK